MDTEGPSWFPSRRHLPMRAEVKAALLVEDQPSPEVLFCRTVFAQYFGLPEEDVAAGSTSLHSSPDEDSKDVVDEERTVAPGGETQDPSPECCDDDEPVRNAALSLVKALELNQLDQSVVEDLMECVTTAAAASGSKEEDLLKTACSAIRSKMSPGLLGTLAKSLASLPPGPGVEVLLREVFCKQFLVELAARPENSSDTGSSAAAVVTSELAQAVVSLLSGWEALLVRNMLVPFLVAQKSLRFVAEVVPFLRDFRNKHALLKAMVRIEMGGGEVLEDGDSKIPGLLEHLTLDADDQERRRPIWPWTSAAEDQEGVLISFLASVTVSSSKYGLNRSPKFGRYLLAVAKRLQKPAEDEEFFRLFSQVVDAHSSLMKRPIIAELQRKSPAS